MWWERLVVAVYARSPERPRRAVVRLVTPGYRVGVLAVLTRPDGRLLLVDQPYTDGWSLPGGDVKRGETIGQGLSAREGLKQPAYFWDPVIAPSGMLFYSGKMFPAWKDSAFIAGLASTKLVRLTMDGQRVAGEEWLLGEREERLRDVREGPDGAIYVATDGGKILRIVAAPKR